MYKAFTVLVSLLMFTSCDMFEPHPYDAKITGERDVNNKNISAIESQTRGKKEFRFAMISDTQRAYDETVDAVDAINARGDIDFVINGGDISDFGVTKEFLMMRDIYSEFDMPCVSIIGNHDHLGTGLDTYRAVFGETNFAFTAGNVRFICLNTNALEYDYTEPVPDFDFIDSELANLSPEIEKTVFAMHAPPFDMVFNNNVNTVFEQCIRRFPNVQFCLYGHGHALRVDDLFGDGLLYYECPNIAKRTYLVFTIHADSNDYDYEAVEF
jgi:Icc-related predicted phosphoesterase